MGTDLDIVTEQNNLINDLQQLDLSKEEAEIYLLLLKNKIMTAGDINKFLPHIQRTYVYNFLTKLKNNGWVHINQATTPQTYNPYPPDEILAKKILEKRNLLITQLESLNQLEEKILPRLNEIHQSNSLKNIPIQFKSVITEFFEDNPSVRIEYTHNPLSINPWLNFFFVSCIFHGFFISWNKQPISDEYSIHFYEFENPITQAHLDLAKKVMELQAGDMRRLLTEREGIELIEPLTQRSLKINGFELVEETIVYQKNENIYEALIIHPWKINKNTIAFFYSNKKEIGTKLLEWIIKNTK